MRVATMRAIGIVLRPRACLAPVGIALLLALALAQTLPAQDASGWIGKRVILELKSVLRVGDEVVDNQKLVASTRGGMRNTSRVYRVERVEGPWVWLQAEKDAVAGWVSTSEVILYDQAIDYFTNLIAESPNSASAYCRRGWIWYERKEYDIAVADYNEAIRHDSNSECAWNNRGIAWLDKGNYDKAVADFSEAIRLDPMYPGAYNNRGRAWYAKSEYDKAITDYDLAIRLDPKFAKAYHNRGLASYVKGDYDKAIADFEEAIRINPKYGLAYNNRGVAWHHKWEFGKAITDFSDAIRLDPNDATAHKNRGSIWCLTKEYERATADYTEAIRLDPKLAGAYSGLAWIWATCPDEKRRNGKKAVQSATKACELSDWKDANILGCLGAAYAEAGEFDSAVKWQTKAIELYGTEKEKEDGRSRLTLYQNKTPYRDVPTPAAVTR